MLDGGVYWIVVEDTEQPPDLRLRKFLYETGLPFAHVTATANSTQNGHRGIPQRNAGIDIVHKVGLPGVVYFADDDNAYDHRLFDELRQIRKVGLFATGFSGGANFEACILDKETGKIKSFATNFVGYSGNFRKYNVDMGGFAINAALILQRPEWRISPKSKKGFMETDMVAAFIDDLDEAEPIGNCTDVYLWHMPKYPKDKIKHLEKKPSKAKAPESYEAVGVQNQT